MIIRLRYNELSDIIYYSLKIKLNFRYGIEDGTKKIFITCEECPGDDIIDSFTDDEIFKFLIRLFAERIDIEISLFVYPHARDILEVKIEDDLVPPPAELATSIATVDGANRYSFLEVDDGEKRKLLLNLHHLLYAAGIRNDLSRQLYFDTVNYDNEYIELSFII